MKVKETQGIYLDVVDFNQLFNTLTSEPIIINEQDISTADGKERLNALLHTRYEGDALAVLPSCDCGETQGQYNLGIVCKNCNSEVLPTTEKPLESTIWLSVPEGIRAFFNPLVWTILSKSLTHSRFNILEWLCNTTYKGNMPDKLKRKLEPLASERRINNVYDNFDSFMAYFDDQNLFNVRDQKRDMLFKFIERNRESIFCQKIPIPSKLSFIVESTATGVYADTNMKSIMDAIYTIASTNNKMTPIDLITRENRSVKAVCQLAEYYESFINDSIGQKHGWVRKHVFGSRLHFTFRAVISSLSENHEYDEIHVPWSMATMVFKTHLTSKLMHRGFSPNEAIRFLYENTLKSNALLEELFNELIKETKENGMPTLFSRNPSLKRGSVQKMRITKVKTDPTINTISMSVLALKAPNADWCSILHYYKTVPLVSNGQMFSL